MTESILDEANRLVNGDRKDTYDGTDDTIVALWSAYLGIELTVLDYAAMMILLKVSRTKGKLHRDSWVDIAGYAEVGPRLWAAKQEPSVAAAQSKMLDYPEPRKWDSLADVPEGVVVTDKYEDSWKVRRRLGVVDTAMLANGDTDWTDYESWDPREDMYAPFTEILARHNQESGT